MFSHGVRYDSFGVFQSAIRVLQKGLRPPIFPLAFITLQFYNPSRTNISPHPSSSLQHYVPFYWSLLRWCDRNESKIQYNGCGKHPPTDHRLRVKHTNISRQDERLRKTFKSFLLHLNRLRPLPLPSTTSHLPQRFWSDAYQSSEMNPRRWS